MLKLILLTTILLPLTATATTSVELVGGSLTYHLIQVSGSENNASKLSSDGLLINNALLGAQLVDEEPASYKAFGGFVGDNSVGETMAGVKASVGKISGGWHYGAVIGFYVQDDVLFNAHGEKPFKAFEIDRYGVVPVVGIEINYKIIVSENTYVKLNNIISPVITNSTVSIGYIY